MVKIDMPMPEYCYFCRFRLSTGIGQRCVAELGRVIDVNVIERPEWCPLKEQEPVPPDVDSEGSCSCGNCGATVGYYPAGCKTPEKLCKICPECGRPVKWE